MRRRDFIKVIAGLTAVWPRTAMQQPVRPLAIEQQTAELLSLRCGCIARLRLEGGIGARRGAGSDRINHYEPQSRQRSVGAISNGTGARDTRRA